MYVRLWRLSETPQRNSKPKHKKKKKKINHSKRGRRKQDVCYPVTKDFREKLYNEIISEYEKAKDKSNEKARRVQRNIMAIPIKKRTKRQHPFDNQ